MGKTTAKVTNLKLGMLDKGINETLNDIGNACVNDLKSTSPRRAGGGAYANGWTYAFDGEKDVVVYNDGDEKTLTHLLELGHVIRNTKDGPVIGHASGDHHIRAAYERAKRKFKQELEEIAK